MSKTIDSRVVEMRFDNKQFESGVKESLSSLQKLKEALNFSKSKNSLAQLDKAASSVSLEGIAAGVEALEKRFSTFGIVGMRVIENLTDSMMGLVSRGINYVNDAIVSGGIKRAMNIENARFQLQSILQDEQRVAEVMNSASKSVDGTAYSFDVAAKAASQFTASGINDIESLDVALRAVAGTTATYNADYESMAMIFTQVAGQGRVMGDQLLQLSTRGANAAVTIKDFVNGVNSGTIEVDEKVRESVRNISTATDVTEADIRDLVSKGKVNFNAFAAAMEYAFGDSAAKANETFTGALANIRSAFARIGEGFIAPLVAQNSEIVRLFNAIRVRVNDVKKALVFDESIGNVNALSKQFSDTVLSMAGVTADFLETLDLTKPLQVFYNIVEALKNVFKGFYSILKPVAKAFSEVFLSFSIEDVVSLTDRLETLTSKFKLSERSSKNLHDTFKGLFSVVNLVAGGFLALLKMLLPIGGPVDSLAGAFLTLTGAAGRALTVITGWVSRSTIIKKAYEMIGTGLSSVMSGISEIIQNADDFLSSIDAFPIAVKFINALADAFIRLGELASPYVDRLMNKVNELRGPIEDFITIKTNEIAIEFVNTIDHLADALNEIDFTKPEEMFNLFISKMKELRSMIESNTGFMTFLHNMQEYFQEMQANLNFERLFENIEMFQEKVGGFVKWIKDTLGPSFDDVTIGGILAGGAGIGMIKSFLKISKSLESAAGALQSIPKALNSVSATLKVYQQELKAEAIKKIAEAIFILAGALVLLSFADNERLLDASIALASLAAGLGVLLKQLGTVMGKGATVNDAIYKFAGGLSSSLKKLGRAMEIKALGKAVKNFAIGIAIVVGSIVALALMYRKDSEAIMAGFEILKEIAIGAIAVAAGMSLLGQFVGKGMKNFQAASSGVLMLSLSLGIVVSALSKLFKMDFPPDWRKKLDVLEEIFVALGLLTVGIGLAGRAAGGAKASTTPLIGVSIALISVIFSLQKLFKMELPQDYQKRLNILYGLLAGLGLVMIAIGAAAKLGGGKLKAAGTILSMCFLIGTVVAALAVLTMLPGDKMLNGALTLGLVLTALALALYGAGNITNDKAYKAVIAMAVETGAIVAALGILSMIPMAQLAKAAAALGSMLALLALDFKYVGSISDENTWKAVAAMVALTVVIAYSLYELSQQPWEGMLAAGVSMGLVLSAVALAFGVIGNAKDVSVEKIALFLAATIALLPVAIALKELSEQPWEGMLAAGAAISMVLLAFTAVYYTAAKANPDLKGIGVFLAASVALLPVAVALYVLSQQPWEGMLAAGAAISEVILAMSAAMLLCSAAGANAQAGIKGIALLDLFIADLAVVLAGLGAIFGSPEGKALVGEGGEILSQIGYAIGNFVGSIVGGLGAGITSGLPAIGQNLTKFMESASGFFNGAKGIDAGSMQGVKYMAETVLILTGGALLQGLTSWLTGGKSTLSEFGAELVKFGPKLVSYANTIKGVDGSVVQNSANAVKVLSDMAKGLPASGGLVEKLFGAKSLSEFGKELSKFGPYLSQYAGSVSGLDSSVVTNSANAAKALSELANNLPNQGGLAGFIFGDNDMSTFGKNLKSFGTSFAGYYNAISGIGVGTITAANTGIKELIAIAQDVSTVNTTGMTGFITGLETMAKTGVKQFAAAFQNSSETINPAITLMLTNASIAMQMKNELFTKKGELSMAAYILGIKNKFNDLTKAGKESADKVILAIQYKAPEFRSTGSNSASSILTGIRDKNAEATSTGQTTAGKIISGVSSKNGEANSAGKNFAGNIVSGITSKNGEANSAGKNFAGNIVSGITSKNGEANSAGQGLGNNTVSGISSKNGDANNAGKNLGSNAVSGVSSKNGDANNAGKDFGSNTVSGISSKNGDVHNAGKGLADNALSGVQYNTGSFTTAGANAGQGFVNGLGSLNSAASAAGRSIASAALDAAQKTLNEHSPSKEMFKIGSYGGEGFVNGLLEWLTKSSKAGTEIADTALTSLRAAMDNMSRMIDSDMELNPVFRPIIDTHDFEQSIDKINEKFNRAISFNAMNVQSAIGAAETIRKDKLSSTAQNESKSSIEGNNFTMIQNNYSPKALSRIDIYRDTRNEFSRFKEAISRT